MFTICIVCGKIQSRGLAWGKHSAITHMILEQGPSEGPHTGEDEVDLIKLSGGIGGSVVFCQQAFQQGTQSLIGQNTETNTVDNMQELSIHLN